MSHRFITRLLGATICAFNATAFAQDTDQALQDVIIVSGKYADAVTTTEALPSAGPALGSDLTQLTARTPGGARIGNGELSGQMQYRGLFGERLNLRVDGQRFASGGPNLMDPVFHYAPQSLVSAVVIDRGVSPVSAGPGLGGGADARFKRTDFATARAINWDHDLSAEARSVNDSLSAGGIIGASTDVWRVNLLGAREDGGDSRFADGDIAGTGFERSVFGASVGMRGTFGELGLDLRRQNTGPSGNPPFPMDIQYFDTDFARLSFSTNWHGLELTTKLSYTDVAHLMDNFSQRPTPSAMAQRATFADAKTIGTEVTVGHDAFGGSMLVGVDLENVSHDVRITNPANPAFFVTPFPDISMDRVGAFAEWSGRVHGLNAQIGVRSDFHRHDAGTTTLGPALPMGPRGLASAFDQADRSVEETTVNGVLRLWTQPTEGLTWRATLAHKQAMPGYIQRYGWLPINASGGLADGNIYVGDLSLRPETALIAEGGFDYQSTNVYFRPTLYVRSIDDYIQGTPFDSTVGVTDTQVETIAAMNGDTTPLRWQNVDARIVGADFDFGADLSGPIRFDSVVSFVRGERRDIDDDLYRMAPAQAMLGITWEAENWSATVETRAVAEHKKVSATNSETESDGYVVVSAFAAMPVRRGVDLSVGIENLFDEVYRDHLSGVNRNGFGDVGIGERVPGAGRGLFLRLHLSK